MKLIFDVLVPHRLEQRGVALAVRHGRRGLEQLAIGTGVLCARLGFAGILCAGLGPGVVCARLGEAYHQLGQGRRTMVARFSRPPPLSSATFSLPFLAAKCSRSGVSPSAFSATISSSFSLRTSPANLAWPCEAATWSAVLPWGVLELRALRSPATSCCRLHTHPYVTALYKAGSMPPSAGSAAAVDVA
ncbi:hypothetical protein PVAP13_1KG342900 [Panicum virgatum]|uniref:Uncharacterized protein n=1 Tax=Panicum virgatum TaxID=38727 RepID=A0A8T0XVA0_PANVG|nr:hypothetical protein PVAP13_1KG342900 [Panicum virgatum]